MTEMEEAVQRHIRAVAAERARRQEVERDRDEWKRQAVEWKRQAELHQQARRVAARGMNQANDDADKIAIQCDRLWAENETLRLKLSGVEVAFP
jgi:membrane protein involved in colicin uptake